MSIMIVAQESLSEALLSAAFVCAIPVCTIFITGLIVAVLQAATQIQEQTLSSVPKIIAVIFVFYLLGPWMIDKTANLTRNFIEQSGQILTNR